MLHGHGAPHLQHLRLRDVQQLRHLAGSAAEIRGIATGHGLHRLCAISHFGVHEHPMCHRFFLDVHQGLPGGVSDPQPNGRREAKEASRKSPPWTKAPQTALSSMSFWKNGWPCDGQLGCPPDENGTPPEGVVYFWNCKIPYPQ